MAKLHAKHLGGVSFEGKVYLPDSSGAFDLPAHFPHADAFGLSTAPAAPSEADVLRARVAELEAQLAAVPSKKKRGE